MCANRIVVGDPVIEAPTPDEDCLPDIRMDGNLGCPIKECALHHLHFVIPIRHPSSVRDPLSQYDVLNQTVRSIANQQEPNWTGWIVANPGQRLPSIPPKFNVLSVDLPVEATLLSARTREQHWAAVRLDKGRRVLQAVRQMPRDDVFMVVDDDDLVSRRLSAFIGSVAVKSGFYIGEGYAWQDGNPLLEPIKDFHRRCGTSLLIRVGFSLLHAPGFGAGDESTISELGSHHLIVDRAIREGVDLEPLPFPGAVYRISSANSDSTHVADRLPSQTGHAPPSRLASAIRRGRQILKRFRIPRTKRSSHHVRVRFSDDLRQEFSGD